MTDQSKPADQNSSQASHLISAYRRIVVKIGSALLVDSESGLRHTWLGSLADDIKSFAEQGIEVLVVSSGAIALGRRILGLPDEVLRLDQSQAAASVGQIELSRVFAEALGRRGLKSGQILLTIGDTEERRRYLNARATIGRLLEWGAVPIINENDTVATSEIRFGDNDRLAARVSTMMSAEVLVLLSDVDGLYTASPSVDPNATRIDHVPEVTPEIEAMAGQAAGLHSRGGMITKIQAAKIATTGGTKMVISLGSRMHPLTAIENGEPSTWFSALESPMSARKKWIAGQLQSAGKLMIDEGAERALRNGKSLLAAGVTRVEGDFSRGDSVAIASSDGAVLACGLVRYDAEEAKMIAGEKSSRISEIIGYSGPAELIHRDDMAMVK